MAAMEGFGRTSTPETQLNQKEPESCRLLERLTEAAVRERQPCQRVSAKSEFLSTTQVQRSGYTGLVRFDLSETTVGLEAGSHSKREALSTVVQRLIQRQW